MRKQLVKRAGYAVAPIASGAALKTGRKAVERAASWALDQATGARRRRARRQRWLAGVGAAALTIPFGMWIGKRLRKPSTDTAAAL
jgi:hypothetical protein